MVGPKGGHRTVARPKYATGHVDLIPKMKKKKD